MSRACHRTCASVAALALAACASTASAPIEPSRDVTRAVMGPTYTDHLAEFLVDAGRPAADPIAAAIAAWTAHEQRLDYLVKQTYFAGLDDVTRAARARAVLEGWAAVWQPMLARMQRLQATYASVVDLTMKSFRRAFGRLPDCEVHLAFVPDHRRYVVGEVFGARVVVINAAQLGDSNDITGRVTVIHGLFEALLIVGDRRLGATAGDGICSDALAIRATSLVYPTLERAGWAALPTPPGVVMLESRLPSSLVELRNLWDQPDPDRSSAGDVRPLIALILQESAFPDSDDVDVLLRSDPLHCLARGREMLGVETTP